MTGDANHGAWPAVTAGSVNAEAASAGGVATQANTQSVIAVWHGVPPQSGQCWHGSPAAVGVAFATGADASVTTGRPATRTARQPRRPARRRKRSIVFIVRSSAGHANQQIVTGARVAHRLQFWGCIRLAILADTGATVLVAANALRLLQFKR